MRDPDDTGMEVRCTCSRRPLLARCGRDRAGEVWVHVKSYKANRLYTEVIATGGNVKIRCRDCERWYTVNIIKGSPSLSPDN